MDEGLEQLRRHLADESVPLSGGVLDPAAAAAAATLRTELGTAPLELPRRAGREPDRVPRRIAS